MVRIMVRIMVNVQYWLKIYDINDIKWYKYKYTKRLKGKNYQNSWPSPFLAIPPAKSKASAVSPEPTGHPPHPQRIHHEFMEKMVRNGETSSVNHVCLSLFKSVSSFLFHHLFGLCLGSWWLRLMENPPRLDTVQGCVFHVLTFRLEIFLPIQSLVLRNLLCQVGIQT